jgi:hypothetical protein
MKALFANLGKVSNPLFSSLFSIAVGIFLFIQSNNDLFLSLLPKQANGVLGGIIFLLSTLKAFSVANPITALPLHPIKDSKTMKDRFKQFLLSLCITIIGKIIGNDKISIEYENTVSTEFRNSADTAPNEPLPEIIT